jgi:hypothetical protein
VPGRRARSGRASERAWVGGRRGRSWPLRDEGPARFGIPAAPSAPNLGRNLSLRRRGHFRIGLGRKGTAAAFEAFEAFLQRRFPSARPAAAP